MELMIESNLFLIQSYFEKEINLFVYVPNILAKTDMVLPYRVRKQFDVNMYGGRFFKKGKVWEMKMKSELIKELSLFILNEGQMNIIANLIESTIANNIDAILAQIELKNKDACTNKDLSPQPRREYEFGTFFYEQP